MSLTLWLSMAAICVLGAVSPGPSLAVVARNTLAGGRGQGLIAAVAHGIGITIWALLTATGIGLLIIRVPTVFDTMRWIGAMILVYFGTKYLLNQSRIDNPLTIENTPNKKRPSPFSDGFLISMANPKIALFFLALFSQFVRPNAGWGEKFIMVATAGLIDTLWYILVVLTLSQAAIITRLRSWNVWIDRIFGIVLISLAISIVANT